MVHQQGFQLIGSVIQGQIRHAGLVLTGCNQPSKDGIHPSILVIFQHFLGGGCALEHNLLHLRSALPPVVIGFQPNIIACIEAGNPIGTCTQRIIRFHFTGFQHREGHSI